MVSGPPAYVLAPRAQARAETFTNSRSGDDAHGVVAPQREVEKGGETVEHGLPGQEPREP